MNESINNRLFHNHNHVFCNLSALLGNHMYCSCGSSGCVWGIQRLSLFWLILNFFFFRLLVWLNLSLDRELPGSISYWKQYQRSYHHIIILALMVRPVSYRISKIMWNTGSSLDQQPTALLQWLKLYLQCYQSWPGISA